MDDSALGGFVSALGRGTPLPLAGGDGDLDGDAGPGAGALALCAWAVGSALPRLLAAAGRPGRAAALLALPPMDAAPAARAAHAALGTLGHGSAYDASAHARRALGHAVVACQGPGGAAARRRAARCGREAAGVALVAAANARARALRRGGLSPHRVHEAGELAAEEEMGALLALLPARLLARIPPARPRLPRPDVPRGRAGRRAPGAGTAAATALLPGADGIASARGDMGEGGPWTGT